MNNTQLVDLLNACDLVEEALKLPEPISPESFEDLVNTVNNLVISSFNTFNFYWAVSLYSDDRPTYGYTFYSNVGEKRKAVLLDLAKELRRMKRKAQA